MACYALLAYVSLCMCFYFVTFSPLALFNLLEHDEELKGCCGYRVELDSCSLTEGLGAVPGDDVDDQQQGLLLIHCCINTKVLR